MTAAKKSLRIGLLWHSLRAGNLGVGALTLGNLAVIRSVAAELGIAIDFTALTMRERATAPIDPDVAQFEITGRTMFNPSGFYAQVKALDGIIDIGAGDSFTDIYGPKRYLYLWLSKYLTLRAKKPLILAPQTIGPFSKQGYIQTAAYAMNRAAAVVARDPASLEAVRTIAPHAASALAVDVAFLMDYADQSALRGHNKTRIGINVSGLLCYQAQTGQNHYGLSYDYLALQRRLIAHWQQDPQNEIHLLTHATSASLSHDNDGHYVDQLAKEFPGTIRVADFAGPREAKSYISGLDFLVAGRMHACIAAFSAQVPVVPLAYSRKFDGLFSQLAYPHVTPVKGLDDEAAFAFVTTAFKNRAALQQDEAQGMTKVDALMENYRQVLRQQLTLMAQQHP